jgi:hypothetical protein
MLGEREREREMGGGGEREREREREISEAKEKSGTGWLFKTNSLSSHETKDKRHGGLHTTPIQIYMHTDIIYLILCGR